MKNTHLEHPEDTILTGDLSVLDALEQEQEISVKYDGAPAIVWGKNPATGRQFVGTKSVFNKVKIKICESPADVMTHYEGHPVQDILLECLKYLPDTENIYQGDFIGFGGESEYQPNTLVYDFDDEVKEQIIVAPHTQYTTTTTLKDAEAKPIKSNLDGTFDCLFIKPNAGTSIGQYNRYGSKFDFKNYLKFVKQMASMVTFLTASDAKAMKTELNRYIRNGHYIHPEDFGNELLISLWVSVKNLKMMALSQCRHRWGPDAYLMDEGGNPELIDAEGYVIHNKIGSYKLIDREWFSHANFNNTRWANAKTN
tara:strand:- start:597 stop:1529 length:933 start_codon:yes stop_codon:yes gene_type:complete